MSRRVKRPRADLTPSFQKVFDRLLRGETVPPIVDGLAAATVTKAIIHARKVFGKKAVVSHSGPKTGKMGRTRVIGWSLRIKPTQLLNGVLDEGAAFSRPQVPDSKTEAPATPGISGDYINLSTTRFSEDEFKFKFSDDPDKVLDLTTREVFCDELSQFIGRIELSGETKAMFIGLLHLFQTLQMLQSGEV